MLLKPADWVRGNKLPDYMQNDIAFDIHKIFLQRTRFENFNSQQLSRLEEKIENALKKWHIGISGKILRFELAVLMMQNKPTYRRLIRAKRLINYILADNQILSIEFKNHILELRIALEEMLKEKLYDFNIQQVNWGIFNKCPLVCKGCYNIFNEQLLGFSESKSVVDKLVNAGVKDLILSGGDPLLWPHIIMFINYANSKNLHIAIDTVGYQMSEDILKKLQNKLCYIGLPLDGSSQEIIEYFRLGKSDLIQQIQRSIQLLIKYRIPIKINTVISRKNIRDLQNIASLIQPLAEKGLLWGWSIFQWWEIRANKSLENTLSVSELDFKAAIKQVSEKHPTLPILCGSIHDRTRTHFFISSNGEVYTFGSSSIIGTIIIGNIKYQSVKEIVSNPALKKTSLKFQSWFSY